MKRNFLWAIVFCILTQYACKETTVDNASTEPPYPALAPLVVSWTDQNSIVCFGTSLTYGYGAGERNPFCKWRVPKSGMRNEFIHFTTEEILKLTTAYKLKLAALHRVTGQCDACEGDSSYPRFLQDVLKIKVYNQGYTAARINTALDVLQDSVMSKNPVLVLLEFGANEFLQGVQVDQADSLLSLLIQRIVQNKVQVVLLSFVHPDMVAQADSGYWTPQDSVRALAYYSMLRAVASRNSLLFLDYPLKGVFGQPGMMFDRLHPNGAGYMKMASNIFFALVKTFVDNRMIKWSPQY